MKRLAGTIGKIEGWNATKCNGVRAIKPMIGEVVTAQKARLEKA